MMVIVGQKIHRSHIAVIIGGFEAIASGNLQRLFQRRIRSGAKWRTFLRLSPVRGNPHQLFDVLQKFLTMGLGPLGNDLFIHGYSLLFRRYIQYGREFSA